MLISAAVNYLVNVRMAGRAANGNLAFREFVLETTPQNASQVPGNPGVPTAHPAPLNFDRLRSQIAQAPNNHERNKLAIAQLAAVLLIQTRVAALDAQRNLVSPFKVRMMPDGGTTLVPPPNRAQRAGS